MLCLPYAGFLDTTPHSKNSRVIELVFKPAVVADATMVIDPECDPLAVVGAAAGGGERVALDDPVFERRAVAVVATARWSLYAGSMTLVAGLGLAGGSNSSVQSKTAVSGAWGST